MTPGRLPKDPKLKQNRNVSSTRAILPAEDVPIAEIPPLPALEEGRKWHYLTELWWQDVWNSPMSQEFLRSDMHVLLRLAMLVDQFYHSPTVLLSAEIRMTGQLFGLSPIDRRRLQWTVAKTEDAVDDREVRMAKHAQLVGSLKDPREILDK